MGQILSCLCHMDVKDQGLHTSVAMDLSVNPGSEESKDGWVKRGRWSARVLKGASRDSVGSRQLYRTVSSSNTTMSKSSKSATSQIPSLTTTSSLATTSMIPTSPAPVSNLTTSIKCQPSTIATDAQAPPSKLISSRAPEPLTIPSTQSSSMSSHNPPMSFPPICNKCGHSLMLEETSPTPSEESDSENT